MHIIKRGVEKRHLRLDWVKLGKKNLYKDTCNTWDRMERYNDVWLYCFHFVYLSPRLVKHKMKDHENSAEVKQK